MDDFGPLFRQAADAAAGYRATLPERRVAPTVTPDALVAALGGTLPAAVEEVATTPNGAIDDLRAATATVRAHGGWVHVDGAFGLWAGASPTLRHHVDGIELADSWGCDGHKWLNVPYDSGYAFCADPHVQAAAVAYSAAYLVGSATGTPAMAELTLRSSRRARGFATWAALRELGRTGVADLVERCCAHARRFADGLRDGTCWMGGTTWRGRRYMRIAVSNATTTSDDVDRSLAAILRTAQAR